MNPVSSRLARWRAQPLVEFERFLQSDDYAKTSRRKLLGQDPQRAALPMSAKSLAIYCSMFGQYLVWLEQNNKDLTGVTHADLRDFLERKDRETGKRVLNSAIALRYLRLFERLYVHLEIEPNPAQHATFQALGGRRPLSKDAPSVALEDDEIERFMAALPEGALRGTGRDPAKGWKRRRDRAMLALMLGAGLKESEVMRIRTEHVGARQLDGTVLVAIEKPSEGIGKDHTAPLLEFAQDEVLAWVAERRRLRIPGDLLFPAAFDGRTMEHATIYRQVNATFQRADIAIDRRGARTLRNTYAVLCIRAGVPLEEVGDRLGHFLERSTIPYAILSKAAGS